MYNLILFINFNYFNDFDLKFLYIENNKLFEII